MSRLNKSLIAIISAMSFSGMAYAQGTRTLTLDEAVQLSLQNSKQLKVSQARIAAAHATTSERKDSRLPDLSVSASALAVTKPTIGGPMGNTAAPNINQAYYGMANAAIPLFSGFKIQNGIESAKYLEEAVKLDAETDKDAVVQNAIAAYSNLYKAQVGVELVKHNLEQAKQRSEEFKNLEKNGVIARNDLLKAQLQESNIQLSLLDAESSLRIANLNMDLMLGLEETTQLALDSTAFTGVKETKSLSDWEQTAMSSRHDVSALSYREKSAISGIRSAKGDYFPSVKLTGGYLGLNVPNFITVSNAWNAGIGVSYSVSSLWKTGSKVKYAKTQLAEVKANQEMLDESIKIQVTQAYEAYMLSTKKIDVYKLAVEQAAENNKISKNKYRNSLITTTDLLEADLQELKADLDYEYSRVDALVAYNKLLQTTGSINSQGTKK